MTPFYFQVFDNQFSFRLYRVITLLSLEEGKSDPATLPYYLMVSVSVRLEELDLYLALDVVFAQVCAPDLHLIPPEETVTTFLLDLRLVDGDPLTRSQVFVQDEKVQSTSGKLRFGIKNDHFAVLVPLDLLSYHRYLCFVFWLLRI